MMQHVKTLGSVSLCTRLNFTGAFEHVESSTRSLDSVASVYFFIQRMAQLLLAHFLAQVPCIRHANASSLRTLKRHGK